MDTWLLTSRAGFEGDLYREAQSTFNVKLAQGFPLAVKQGWLIVEGGFPGKDRKPWRAITSKTFTFSRQTVYLFAEVEYNSPAELLENAIGAALDWRKNERMARGFSAVFVERPDTPKGRALLEVSNALEKSLEKTLRFKGLMPEPPRGLPRLHLFIASPTLAFVGVSDPNLASPHPMGIPGSTAPEGAPDESAAELSYALDFFIPQGEHFTRLKAGMRAVNLGALPGGWSWELTRRGLLTTAVDRSPLPAPLTSSNLLTPVVSDNLSFKPEIPVHWLFCDIAAPAKLVADLVARWSADGLLLREALFKLRLTERERSAGIGALLDGIKARVEKAGAKCSIISKHLYGNKNEVTCHLRLTAPIATARKGKGRGRAKGKPQTQKVARGRSGARSRK
ncbi:MAG: 23S rRNA (cytidine(2498)-2'-O)-methyltransferase RlmM [Deltaproteobacteria bacterium]|nr:MAG: 23S rRNA (cytidine(2498)-2'-O)-methyltransferase RlmM [Deltaproteobacteria bacterium]